MVGGWAANISGSYLMPSIIAAGVLVVGALLLIPVIAGRD